MALAIKNTPILKGKAAAKFIRDVKENENRPISKSSCERAIKTYNALKKKFGEKV